MKLSRTLIKGSIILLITFNIYNLLNFLFQFSMARVLTTAEYGTLAALFSILIILAIPSETIQTVITKYTAKEKDKGKIKNILKKAFRKSLKLSITIFIIYAIFSLLFFNLLKIRLSLLLITGLFIFISFTIPILRGILQGEKKFGALGLNLVSEGVIKLVLGVSLVLFLISFNLDYLKVHGAIFSAIFAGFFALLIAYISLNKITNSKEKKCETIGIYNYTRPSFIIIFVIFIFFNLDIIFAKILFSPELAGVYSYSSILAKTIFLVTQPISRAMFPITSQQKPDSKEAKKLFTQSLLIVLACIFVALVIVFFFSDLIISIYTGEGKSAQISSEIFFPVSIAISLLSITNLNLLYKLSLNKTKRYLLLLLFIPIEAILFILFSENLMQFSIAFISSAAIFLIGSFILIKQ